MPSSYIPERLNIPHRRKVGMIVRALTLGPTTISGISTRLKYNFKYKLYPNPRAIANYLCKYSSLFEIEEKTRKYTIWKLRDDINVMDRKTQTEESE